MESELINMNERTYNNIFSAAYRAATEGMESYTFVFVENVILEMIHQREQIVMIDRSDT